MGAGLIKDLKEAREVVRRSFQIDRLEAKPSPEWDRAYDRYRGITGK
jgi:hypothetical protein